MSAEGQDFDIDASTDEELAQELERRLAFNREVSDETRRMRVRETAREVLAAEKAAASPAPPYDSGTLREMLERPADPPHRIEGLIPSAAGTLIVAQRKTGKTTLALNLARALISGEHFLGRFAVRPIQGIVTILNYEVSGQTLTRWAHEHGIDPDRCYVVNLRGARNPLLVPAERLRLAQDLKARGTECLIVDTYSRAAAKAVTEKGNSGQVSDWLTELDYFTRTEVGAQDLILTTHAGWSADARSRDSSALEDWPDSIIVMTKNEDGDRFLSAIGRDVDLDEDQLSYDTDTRTLALTGSGSRKQSQGSKKAEGLALYVRRAASQCPGGSRADLTRLIRGMADAPTFQDRDIAKAAEYAAAQGFLTIVDNGSGKAKNHYPATPSNPVQTPSTDAPLDPVHPVYMDGVGVGVPEALPDLDGVEEEEPPEHDLDLEAS
ncbi:AAA family ATPase [Knoellia sp. CPCC 206453]|uniref:AAA family ATPase n=1 Tax=Knoellia pratensis TaxID=3404796 RepID=UPI00360A60E6